MTGVIIRNTAVRLEVLDIGEQRVMEPERAREGQE